MKKIFLVLLLGFCASLQAQVAGLSTNLQTTVTNLAAGTTYSIPGPAWQVWNAKGPFSVYISFDGVAGSTSGIVEVVLATAPGDRSIGSTNEFESASQSELIVSAAMDSSTTNRTTKREGFEMEGGSYIRVARVRQTTPVTISNLTVRIGYNR